MVIANEALNKDSALKLINDGSADAVVVGGSYDFGPVTLEYSTSYRDVDYRQTNAASEGIWWPGRNIGQASSANPGGIDVKGEIGGRVVRLNRELSGMTRIGDEVSAACPLIGDGSACATGGLLPHGALVLA